MSSSTSSYHLISWVAMRPNLPRPQHLLHLLHLPHLPHPPLLVLVLLIQQIQQKFPMWMPP